MHNLTTSLASSSIHCSCGSVTHSISAVELGKPLDHGRGTSSIPTRLKWPLTDGRGALKLSPANAHLGLKEEAHELARTQLPRSRKRVAVKSQVATGMEAAVADKVETGDSVQKVVIVGAGIAGLSTAVALHRYGLKVLVLEQSPTMRTTGSSLTLWGNAWRAVDYLGVGEVLRERIPGKITGIALINQSEKILRSFGFDECPGGPHEVRAVDRKILAETLAEQLPAGSIQLGSRVSTIQNDPQTGLTKVELENGSVISTKALLGCDGVHSVVGKWLGLSPTRYSGVVAIRGDAVLPNGHGFGSVFSQYVGVGKRCGVVPTSPNKVSWFVTFTTASPGPRVTDPNLVKAEALRAFGDGWPDSLKEMLKNSPVETVSRAALGDRWNIPGITAPVAKGGVTVAGDAFHPMTPYLGQGGCTAIEDAVVLARTLRDALYQEGGDNPESIQKALEEYAAARQKRTFGITFKAFIMGQLMDSGFPPMVYLRDNFVLPRLVRPDSFLTHTLFDVGSLSAASVD